LVHADEKAKYQISIDRLSKAIDRQFIEYFDLNLMTPDSEQY